MGGPLFHVPVYRFGTFAYWELRLNRYTTGLYRSDPVYRFFQWPVWRVQAYLPLSSAGVKNPERAAGSGPPMRR